MSIHKLLTFLIFLLMLPGRSGAQGWSATYLGGPGNESIDDLIPLPDGGALVLVSYDAPWEVSPGVLLPHLGRRDLALLRLDKDKQIVWQQYALGPDLDENKGLVLGQDGAIYWTGNCWDGLTGSDWVLNGLPGLRSVFLIKVSLEGQVLRTQLWGGDNLKSVEAMTQTEQGVLVLAGFFRSRLWIDTDTLTAVGNTDAFVVGCDTSLQLLWQYQGGATKDCRALHLAALPGDQVAVSGYFDGSAILGSDTLTASSNDEDVWLAIVDPMNGFIDAWRAGGVLNSRPESMTYVSNTRQIAIAGTFSGVMQVRGATPSIQSAGLATNGFVWLYSPSNLSHKLLNYGTTALEALRTTVANKDTLYVAGYYEGSTRIGSLDLPGLPAQGQGFLMAIDSAGNLVQVIPIGVSDRLSPSQLLYYNNSIALTGAYRGKLEASPSVISNGFDGFHLVLSTIVNALAAPELARDVQVVQPCPAQCLVLEAPQDLEAWYLFSLQGQLLATLPISNVIDLSHFKDGNYLLGWKGTKSHTLNGLKIISKISY